ncbi:alpha-L-rhamnosidase [Paenibacillus lactis]|uniref:alpha-L-rhamnosidase n=1 Tax=Paenibacillus lactis TaxID=228574 RepID=UPI001B1C43D6|nr:alpha-L-rhamnosidase [Paenibacillus lactis]GIO89179.1 alpha-rhamnosidase [Paenibacillus lactis]
MLRIQNPRVNGLNAPPGLDERVPVFSWQLTGTRRGEEPAACRVKVASTKAGLRSEDGEVLWDSGKRCGHELSLSYEGPALRGNRRYWWQAEVWDCDGSRYAMEPAWWETGLFSGDWQAEWIWRAGDIVINDFVYFRKTFELGAPVVRAKLFVSAHHIVQLYVNGQRVSGFGSPAPTGVPRRKFYLAYDVTSLLSHGANCIGACVHYLGGSGQNYVDGSPGLLLQLHAEHADGSESLVASDRSWRTLRRIPHRIGTSYQQNRRLSAVEDYDRGQLDPRWLTPAYDDSLCDPAVAASPDCRAWPLMWQRLPEGAELELIQPTAAGQPRKGAEGWVQVFDAGKIVSGWPRITLPGKAGVTVQLRYAESLDPDGRVPHQVCNEISHSYFDRYTMHGRGGPECWQPDFSYKAFRYVEVSGYPAPLEKGQLTICAAGTDMERTGHFRCSSAFINKLYDVCMQTQRNNVLGQVVDCPHREQAQYLADTDLQAEALLYNFEAVPVLDKTLGDFADGQLPDGTFPFVFPSNYLHPDFNLRIPEWDLHYATLLWKLYRFTGDRQLLLRHYGPMRQMIDAYISGASPETRLIPVGDGWHISDWPYPTVEHEGEFLTVQQIKAWQALRIAAEAADVLGKAEDQEMYERQAAALRSGILTLLYDPFRKLLRDSSGSQAFHQGVNALAIYAGLLPEEDREAAVEAVAGMPWESRTVLSLPLVRLLFEEGRSELAYQLLSKSDNPGWGYMIAQGAETLWEGWDDIESHCHAWNGYPARLLQEYICGIQSGKPGFAEARIRPFFPDELEFAEAAVPTVRGSINVRWERVLRGGIRLRVTLPCTMKGLVVLDSRPDRPIASIADRDEPVWEDGAILRDVPGIAGCRLYGTRLELELLSGDYELMIRYAGEGL